VKRSSPVRTADASSISKQKKKKRPLNSSVFTALYTLGAWGVYFLSTPFVLLLSFKDKYRQSLPARFFLWKNPPLPENGVWFHACSFGETRAIAPLVAAFEQKHPHIPVYLTTTTQTGHAEATRLASYARYLPFEPLLWRWVRPQKALVVMEAELWYLLFYLAKARGASTMLINARISDRSFPRYRRFAWFYRQLFAHVDKVFSQSETDRKRLEALGAKNVVITGNIKLAATATVTKRYEKPEGIVVTAASTHEGEEAPILEAFFAFKKAHPEAKLLIVPRHPERFDKVAAMAQEAARREGASFSRWSQSKDLKTDIVLVDAMGELINFYAISDIVVLGGAFAPVGGHNPAEVLPFGCKLITGRHIFNQRAIFSQMKGAIFCDPDTLLPALEEAMAAPALQLETDVSFEPILKELDRVV
jgi:3-deoxy-D-manno-octulosonic-acid transferase